MSKPNPASRQIRNEWLAIQDQYGCAIDAANGERASRLRELMARCGHSSRNELGICSDCLDGSYYAKLISK